MRRIEAREIIVEVEKGTSTYDFHTLGLPFGGPYGGRDLHQKWFSPRTNFGIEKGHMLPTVHFHGKMTRGKRGYQAIPEFLGTSEFMGVEDDGGWFMTRVNKTHREAKRLYDAGREKALRASTGLAGTLQRFLASGEYLMWVPGEMSLMEKTKGIIPVNDLAISTSILKGLYIDNGLEWSEMVEEPPPDIEPRQIKLVPRKRIILK